MISRLETFEATFFIFFLKIKFIIVNLFGNFVDLNLLSKNHLTAK